MNKFKVLLMLAVAFCFTQSSFAQGECERYMNNQMAKLKTAKKEMSAEQAAAALNKIMRSYQECMGQAPRAEEREEIKEEYYNPIQRVGSESPERILRPEINSDQKPSPVLRRVPINEGYKSPEQEYRKKETPIDRVNREKREREQNEVNRQEEQGQNPKTYEARLKKAKEYCKNRTAKQVAQIIKQRDAAISKITSATQRRKIMAEASQKINAIRFACTQSMMDDANSPN